MITLAKTNIRVLTPVTGLDYFDSQSADLTRSLTPLDAWNIMMTHPQPILKIAFQIRDAISSLFGVKKIGGFSGVKTEHVEVGDFLDFFLVEYSDETALVLTERDRHLDVMTCISTDKYSVTVTSSVKVHNLFGRLYMIPVGIAHKWIVRRTLKRLQHVVATHE